MPEIGPLLTDIQIKNATLKEKAYQLADGMYLGVMLSGTRTWHMSFV